MEYITTKEASKKWGISTIRITILANEGRIPGAYRLGRRWLIPASATKPKEFKPSRSGANKIDPDTFSFPLYHLRPDWNSDKEAELSRQQQILFQTETAVLECRFDDAYLLLKPILKSPDDIVIEIGSLGIAGICCIALNKPQDFSTVNLRLQMLLNNDFPHRDDLALILKFLKTYVDTIDDTAKNFSYNPNIHDQSMPYACTLLAFAELAKETIKPGSANIALLEANLRLLKNAGAVLVAVFTRCYLINIYYIRQNIEAAEKHAKAAVEVAFENKFYLPLISFYRYSGRIFDPILAQYPEEIQEHYHVLATQYEENFSAFLSSINEGNIFAKLTDDDYAYAHGVFAGLSNTEISKKLGVSTYLVKRRLASIYEKLGVTTKKELVEYIQKYM